MSKQNKTAGELFMAGFMGTDPIVASELIQRYHVGGIILFSRNIMNADHARSVCAKLQQLRQQVSDSPLFIAIDQEGGCVARITEGVTVFPGNMALGALGSEQPARQVGETMGSELSALGINVNFAPVLDICSNPQNPGVGARSFGSEPETVSRLGLAIIYGMQEKGICATAKHFPGLGEARVDSHDELPIINVTRAELAKRELLPFRAAIDAGVPFIMTAHCSYPSLDDKLTPATLSRPILGDLLRGQMGFRKIVITDCLEMAAIEKKWSTEEAAQKAFCAGSTMLLVCHTRQKQIDAIENLTHVIEKGKIQTERVDAATEAISSVKKTLKFSNDSPVRNVIPNKSLSETIATNAVSIIRNKNHIIPLRPKASETITVIVPGFDTLTKVEEAAEPHRVLLEELKQRHTEILYQKVSVEPSAEEIRACMEMGARANILLILTYNLNQYATQHELVDMLINLGKRTIVAAVRDPYDLRFVPEAEACIATFGFRECSLKALARILFGESESNGKMPIEFD